MRQTLKCIRVVFDEPISIFYDNTSAIKISKNIVMHSREKHIAIRYQLLRDKVMENEVKLQYIPT